VISPLLANLFLHYAFDKWMAREFPHIGGSPDPPLKDTEDGGVLATAYTAQATTLIGQSEGFRRARCGNVPDAARQNT
jgi:retron-type reverse transcriptase